jgi:hypothetical protein
MERKRKIKTGLREKLEAADSRPESVALLENIKRDMDKLEALLAEATHKWRYEDGVYRFYHQSFKVYSLQSQTLTTSVERRIEARGG